jgi:phosphate transport system substrate-binding protein
MLNRTQALGGKVVVALILGASLAVAACGGGTSTTGGSGPTATANPLTACKAHLSAGGTSKATATQYPGTGGKLAVDGSTALAPFFSQIAGEFDAANSTHTTVTPNGSGTGLHDVEAGAVQIGMSDVFAQQKATSAGQYADLVDHQVMLLPFTLVTNNDLSGKVDNLTTAQIKQIYSGQYTNWQQVGGPNEPITAVARPTSSGTRSLFDTYILQLAKGTSETASQTLQQDTSGAVESAVAATPGSIGYLAASYVVGQGAGQTSPICIDGADATQQNIDAGKYQYFGIEHAYTKGPAAGNAKAIITYAQSSAVQQADVLSTGGFPISGVSASVLASHTPSGAPAPENLGS